ncbi:MAG: NTP transferase domain-containing protein [archaeon]|nr:NTP transferase domain-containing protein [archaeon]
MKGIILSAGKGTRLYPASSHISKILLPIYDKPMIYYPLATLMSAGIRDILVVVSSEDRAYFEKLLRDGSQFGVSITYAVQTVQRGIADALLVGEEFIDGEPVALALGDNIFDGEDMSGLLENAMTQTEGATVFCKPVKDPRAFGVATMDSSGNVVNLVEKPKEPESDLAVVGLYFYDGHACEYAKQLEPSARGELEITDLNRIYLEKGQLKAQVMSEFTVWADTGTFDSMLSTSNYISERQADGRTLVGSPEKVAFEKGFISGEQLLAWISQFKSNSYFECLRNLAGSE